MVIREIARQMAVIIFNGYSCSKIDLFPLIFRNVIVADLQKWNNSRISSQRLYIIDSSSFFLSSFFFSKDRKILYVPL